MKNTFFSDAGHGWLRVSILHIAKLGIAGNISCFSYIRNTNVYLEEDCDAEKYLAAMESVGKPVSIVAQRQSSKSSKIRNYDSFSIARFNAKMKEYYPNVGVNKS